MTDQARHLARIASALERIADQFEKGSDELDVTKDRSYFDKSVRKGDSIASQQVWDRCTGMSE